jgi:sulfite reductase beta subunit-like hemoprotein
LSDFIPRADVVAAAEALIDVFVTHGDLDNPAKGRLKFVAERCGAEFFRQLWADAFAARRAHVRPAVAPVEVLSDDERAAVLAQVPIGGWSAGVRPQRTPGLALVTVHVTLGDLSRRDMNLLADIADLHGDGALVVSRDQDVVLRNVSLGSIPEIRSALAERDLFLLGDAHGARIRACTGSAVCAIGITTAPEAGRALLDSGALQRNSALRVSVSGCPNSCAQHQAADIGLSGAKVRVGGATRQGYQVFLGGGLDKGRVGEIVGRVAEDDVPAVVDAIVGIWEALRHASETIGDTVSRIGADAVASHVAGVLDHRWAAGPEPALSSV